MNRKKRIAAIVVALVLLAALLLALWLLHRPNASPNRATAPPAMGKGMPLPSGPTILTQPASQTARAPATATFDVAARDAVSYQWQISLDAGATFIDIPGAVYERYTTPPTSGTDAARLVRVVVGNSRGGITVSNAAQLTVTSSKLAGAPVSVSFSRGGMRVVARPSAGSFNRTLQGASFVQTIANDGSVTTLAGSGLAGYANGVGNAASFDFAEEAVANSAGDVYVTDTQNHVIRRITPAGVVTTFAGSGNYGSADGPGAAASFATLRKIVFDPAGNLYVSDGNRIRKITPAGLVSTLAGGMSGRADGIGTQAQFLSPDGLALDPAGTALYVADTGSNSIRKVSLPDGATTTLTGNWSGSPRSGFNDPNGLALDAAGSLYVCDGRIGTVHRVSPAGVVTTLAGTGTPGRQDGPASVARFAGPNGVAVDDAGGVWVSESINQDIRLISTGVVSTVVRADSLAR